MNSYDCDDDVFDTLLYNDQKQEALYENLEKIYNSIILKYQNGEYIVFNSDMLQNLTLSKFIKWYLNNC